MFLKTKRLSEDEGPKGGTSVMFPVIERLSFWSRPAWGVGVKTEAGGACSRSAPHTALAASAEAPWGRHSHPCWTDVVAGTPKAEGVGLKMRRRRMKWNLWTVTSHMKHTFYCTNGWRDEAMTDKWEWKLEFILILEIKQNWSDLLSVFSWRSTD